MAIRMKCIGYLLLASLPFVFVSLSQGQNINTGLTTLGGELAGNADNTIPPWKPEDVMLPGWSYGKLRKEYFKYKDDKAFLTIDSTNADKHANNLTQGQLALLKHLKTYKMQVYPSRRYCSSPDFVINNTNKNIGFARIGTDGWSLEQAYAPGIPFVQPKSGVEAMYNSKLHYHGIGVAYKQLVVNVSSRKAGGERIQAEVEQIVYFPWGTKGTNLINSSFNTEVSTYVSYLGPAALAGQAFIASFYFDKPASETFYYFPGQRRVRRMSTYAYDSPQIGYENQYNMDETNMFTGPIDRFNWKLLGKKEIYVPYSSFGAYNFKTKLENVAKDDMIAPSERRYELHRVWVVEGTVKPGVQHLSSRRVFYLDEDSWVILLADDYDAQGKLWKHREGYLIPVYEGGMCDVAAFAQYNLIDSRYLMDFHSVGAVKDLHWITEDKNDPRFKPSYYTSDNLRAMSER